jgi:hypothetical protein
MKGSRIVKLALWVMGAWGGGGTALADVQYYSFTPIAFPGASLTEAWGINDSGQVVGYYGTPTQGFLSQQRQVGFRIKTEPTTLPF